jgi:hypothetical protein
MATFESFFNSTVEPLLASGRHGEAIAGIEEFFPQLATDFDRSEAFHWLASLHSLMGSRALAERDIPAARDHFGDVQEFALKALDMFPERPDTLVFLARFYLAPLGQPERAFPLLQPFAEGHRVQPEPLLFYDHVRLVLRGVVLAVIGSGDEAFEDWRRAYSNEFLSLAPDKIDTTSLLFVGAHGVDLPAGDWSNLMAQLGELGIASDRLERLRGMMQG